MSQGKRPSDLYERALEHLSGRIEENGSLSHYLDRNFSPKHYGNDSDISPHKASVPRLWFHTSNALPQSEQSETKTIRQLKMEALERAIEALSKPSAVTKKRKLKRLPLRKLRKSG